MIYHYTTLENFVKKIESKELYLFNAYNMNDNLEINWINHLIDDEFQNYKEEALRKLTMEQYYLNSSAPYICCFSYDGDLLSQWRAYAEDGSGIAIGFDETQFNVRKKVPTTNIFSDNSTGLVECIYDEQEQRNLIHSTIDSNIVQRNAYNGNDEQTAFRLSSSLRMFSLVMKNPSFVEENEIRLIHTPLIMEHTKTHEIQMAGNISPLFFMKKSQGISSYFKFSLKSIFDNKLIPEIILGPKCNINMSDLDLFLLSNNLSNTKIKKSKASYR